MLYQEELIEQVRKVCAEDAGLDAALMYGSFAAGEGDEHSDIEFWLFFTPDRLAGLDPRAWCEQIAPVTHGLVNEFGSHVVFFPGLVRGEFHFVGTDRITEVGDWPTRAPIERMLVLDRRGALEPVLRTVPEGFTAVLAGDAPALEYCDRFANWLVLALHLTARGEHLRAWDALAHVQRQLTWMGRLAEQSVAHWLTPSRNAERELSWSTVAGLRAATSAAGPHELIGALRAAHALGRRLWSELAARHGAEVPEELLEEVRVRLDRLAGG